MPDISHFTKDQLLALMNTVDFAMDNDASYEEYTIIKIGTSDLQSIRDILYNKIIEQGKPMTHFNSSFPNSSKQVGSFTDIIGREYTILRERVNGYVQFNVNGMIFDNFQEVREYREELQSHGVRVS